MKLSVKLPEDQQRHKNLSPLITAKIPISILNQPFLSSVSTNSLSSDLSLSLSSNFSSGPSLKLSYSPTSTTASSPPFSLCLKSGLGVFGSPSNSPLVFKALFSLSSPNPIFSLHFKPQFGDFALKKTAPSNPRSGSARNSGSQPRIEVDSGSGLGSNVETGNGFSSEGSSVWQEVKLEPRGGSCFHDTYERSLGSKEPEKDGFFTGIAIMARTVFPVTKKLEVKMRWGVNLSPDDSGFKMPRLTMNKIAIERRVENEDNAGEAGFKKMNVKSPETGDSELLKGMCLWMSRDLEALERENKQMKISLEQMKKQSTQSVSEPPRAPLGESSGGFEKWKNRKNVKDESTRREMKKPSNEASDLESELQRAIKAAAAGSST